MKNAARRSDLVPAVGFLLPNFLGFLVFTVGPVAFSLIVAFTNWNLIPSVPLRFVGLGNFAALLSDEHFWLYFINTVYLMIGIPFAIVGSLLLAVLLSQKLKGIVIYRTLFYIPSFTSGVAIMILWKALYNPSFGPIDTAIAWVLHALHMHGQPPEWLSSTKNVLSIDVEHVRFNSAQFGLGARDAIIIMGIWVAAGGNNMLLYLAALTNVPPELYEAAQMDGANRWQCFWNVTWPQLAPTTFFITIISMIGGLQAGFDQARVMTNGGPAETTTTLAYDIYTTAFEQFKMGYASAISWVLFIIVLVVTLVNWKFGNRQGDVA